MSRRSPTVTSKRTLIVMVKMKPISKDALPLACQRRRTLERQMQPDGEEHARPGPHREHAGDLDDELERVELDQRIERRGSHRH